MSDNTIFLSPQGTQIKHEDNLASGTAFPGMLLEFAAAGEVVTNSNAEDVAPLFMLADLSTTILEGAQLASAGNGSVKTVAVADVGVIAYALEAVTTTGATDFILAIVK